MPQQNIQIIEFSAPLCSACQEVAKTLTNVLSESQYQGKIGFQKVNGLENIPLLTKFGLADGKKLLESTAFPVTIFMKDNQEVERKLDAFGANELRNLLDQLLASGGQRPFAGVQFSGGIVIRSFYDDNDQDADFKEVKAAIKDLMGESEVFKRIHFEWQSKSALFARRYELDKHPEGPVTIFFDKDGKERGRIEGVANKATLAKAIIQTFKQQDIGTIHASGQIAETKKTDSAAGKAQYASAPQRKLRLVNFYKDHCASCNALKPTIDETEQKYQEWVDVQRVHGEQQPDILQKYQRKADKHLMFYPMVFIETEGGDVLYSSDHYKHIQQELDLKLRHFLFLETV